MINIKEDEKLNVLNHSCAHLLAQAVKHLYPNAKFWVGPVIEEGFYYDIDLGDEVITEEDLPKIEKEMKKCSKDNKRIVREEISKEEALERFKDDPNAVFKYAQAKDLDIPVIKRVKEVADKMKISMALVALAWIYSKPYVAAPVLGFTKLSQLEEAVKVFSIKLAPEDIKYLEELYVPHPEKGPMKKDE